MSTPQSLDPKAEEQQDGRIAVSVATLLRVTVSMRSERLPLLLGSTQELDPETQPTTALSSGSQH